jgi:hypothetical protein
LIWSLFDIKMALLRSKPEKAQTQYAPRFSQAWWGDRGGGMNAIRVFLAACASLILATSPAVSTEYPDRPVTIIVGYNAGGGTDIVARRLLAQ